MYLRKNYILLLLDYLISFELLNVFFLLEVIRLLKLVSLLSKSVLFANQFTLVFQVLLTEITPNLVEKYLLMYQFDFYTKYCYAKLLSPIFAMMSAKMTNFSRNSMSAKQENNKHPRNHPEKKTLAFLCQFLTYLCNNNKKCWRKWGREVKS